MPRESTEPVGLRELAERLLSRQHPLGKSTAELYPGELPPGREAKDVTFPRAARLIGSVAHRRDGRLSNIECLFELDQPGSDALASYEHDLQQKGWQVRAGPWGGGGFMPSDAGFGRAYRRGSTGPILWVDSWRLDSHADLRVKLDLDARQFMPRPHQEPPGMRLVPGLSAPPGVKVEGGGSSGGDSNWTTQARATTDMTPQELEAYFGQQLSGAEWTRLAGDSSDQWAWSGWGIDKEPKWHGVLIVMALPSHRERMLLLHLQGPPQSRGGFASAVSSLWGG